MVKKKGSTKYGFHWDSSLVSKFENMISNYEGGEVLDAGAGDGYSKSFFDKSWEWTGIDFSPRSSLVKPGDLHNLKFENNRFDIVLSIAVFEHLHSPWVAMEEIFRVLKPGGSVFGTVAFLEPEHSNSYFHMTQHGISHLLERSGFVDINISVQNNWTVVNSMNIIPNFGLYRNAKSRLVLSIRKSVVWFHSKFFRKFSKEEIQALIKQQEFIFSGSFTFQATKIK